MAHSLRIKHLELFIGAFHCRLMCLYSFFRVSVKEPLRNVEDEFVLSPDILIELGPPAGETADPSKPIYSSSNLSAGATAENRANRMKLIKELTPRVKEQKLQEHGVELIWVKTKDLLETADVQQRHDMLMFYEAMIRGQYEQLDVVRGHFFRLIKHLPKNDTPDLYLIARVKLLDALTEQGKDILHFEDEIGQFLKKIFPIIMNSKLIFSSTEIHFEKDSTCPTSQPLLINYFLNILLNIIKFNSAYLDADVVCEFIANLGEICLLEDNIQENIESCLKCMDAILCYTYIPKEALQTYMYSICLVVNMEEHNSEAWRITRNVMKTHLGHSALYCLCQFIQTGEGKGNTALVRGSVCLVGKSLWGPQRIEQLNSYSPMTILPTFVEALNFDHPLVIFEVITQLSTLVDKSCYDLRATGTDAVLSLVEMLLIAIPEKVQRDATMKGNMLTSVHNIISTFEKLILENRYVGSKHRFYSVVERCYHQRPEYSVISLLIYRANEIYPTRQGWIEALNELMEKYFHKETRPGVRMKALAIMMDVLRSNRQIYEEELLEKVVVPLLIIMEQEEYDHVILEAIDTFSMICIESSSKRCLDILEALKLVTVRPLELKSRQHPIRWSECSHDDVSHVINGLINIMCSKVCQPSAFIVEKAYSIIVSHLEDNYENPDVFLHTGSIRSSIFRLFMRMRANEFSHLGIEEENDDRCPGSRGKEVIHFSPYLICQQPETTRKRNLSSLSGNSLTNQSSIGLRTLPTYISLTRACRLVITCLSKERDWQVLKLVLAQVPSVLQNKAILSRYGTALHKFVDPLIDLTKPNSPYPDCLKNLQMHRLSKSDFHNAVYPVLAAMAPYNEYLESMTTRALINTLQNGLLSRDCNRFCIVALTACALEMRKSMYAKIPEVLLNFTKISPTKQIATPMLEFLSTLIRLPDIFSSFTDTHYMYVFAIVLPFTNPFKFDEYTVSLAHHVIVMWFLKCRLAYRQNFVQFIISGLNSNVLSNFDEGGFRKGAVTMAGKTSSNAAIAAKRAADKFKKTVLPEQRNSQDARPRAASFTDTPIKSMISAGTRDRHATGVVSSSANTEASMDKMMVFHQELSETCVDLLARYMFANASVKPRRLPTTEFLLKGGQSASWIVGTMIITVTTSICDQTSSRGELCDRCYLICNASSKAQATTSYQDGDGAAIHDKTPTYESDVQSNDETARNFEEFSSRKRHASAFVGSSPVKSEAKHFKDLWDKRRSSNSGLGSIIGRRVSVSDEILIPIDAVGQNIELQRPSVKKDEENLCDLEKQMVRHSEAITKSSELCACWCSGWAEIHVRRPSGDVSWMCRVQNPSLSSESHADIPLTDLTALFQPSMEPSHTISTQLDPQHVQKEKLTDHAHDNPSKVNAWPRDDTSPPLIVSNKGTSERTKTEEISASEGFKECQDKSEIKSCEVDSSENLVSSDEIMETEESKLSSLIHATSLSGSVHQHSPKEKTSPNTKLLLGEKSRDHDISKTTSSNQKQSYDPIAEEVARSSQKMKVLANQHKKLEVAKSESRRPSAITPEFEIDQDKFRQEQRNMRDRAHTISGLSPRKAPLARQPGNFAQVQNKSGTMGQGSLTQDHKPERVTGISPQFVFLTLYHSYGFGRMQNPAALLDSENTDLSTSNSDTPILVPNSESIKMAIKSLDRIHA